MTNNTRTPSPSVNQQWVTVNGSIIEDLKVSGKIGNRPLLVGKVIHLGASDVPVFARVGRTYNWFGDEEFWGKNYSIPGKEHPMDLIRP